mgnify:FL=1
MQIKVIRACTVPQSIGFVVGMIPDLTKEYEVGVLSSPGVEWAMLDKYGDAVKRLEVPMERHISPLRDLRSLWRLVRVFRRERPDMVHSMTPKAGLLCMLAAWITRVPVRVHMFTGLVFPTATGVKRRILMATDRLTCACATHVLPEGEGVKRDLLDNGITRKPIKVLGYGNCRGIDLDRFDPTLPEIQAEAAKLRKPEVFTFIAIGRLVGDKGINELVAAFSRLNRELPATCLILVGPQEKELDPLSPATLSEIESNPAIEAVGNQADVRPWLAAADCHVLASYREGFPNVVIEAGAMGLPQIVTDINGVNEIIINGRNGVIVPPKNADAIHASMSRMATDPAFRSVLAANARPLIASRYEQSYVRRCLKEYYKEILNDRI